MRKVRIGAFETTDEIWENIKAIMKPEEGEPRITHGPLCAELEQKFAALHGCKYGIVANSGTSALHVTVQAMKELYGWQDGDEVIVPALTFPATINVVLHNNLKPVFVDVDRDYYTIDPALVGKAITKRTKAIIPVHLFGQPADMGRISDICVDIGVRPRIFILEDACETAIVSHGKHPVGFWGHAACFSFYISHILTGGVGGIVTTSNHAIASKVVSLVNHGWDRRKRPVDVDKFDMAEIASRYYFTSIGHSFRMTEFAAALVLPQLQRIGAEGVDDKGRFICPIKQRQSYAEKLTFELERLPPVLQLPKIAEGNEHAFMMYPIVVKDNAPFDKWQLIAYLERNGIETREMLPLTNQPCYEGLVNEGDYPVAKWINERGLYIGCHNLLTDEDLSYTVGVFKEFLG
jgi:dTDP-4-amino-4,6-dideoxygalactose transaminase